MISAPLMTSHGPDILKLNPPQYPTLVENESFFLDMAASCEQSTPEHRIVHDRNGRSGLLVRRFDRIVETGTLRRLAQEDACQVMNAYPARKYALRLGDIGSTLATTCERGGGSRAVERMLDRLCERAQPWLDRLDTIGYDDRVTALLHDAMERRVSELRAD